MLLERLSKSRLEKQLDFRRDFSVCQFGFTKQCSSIRAIKAVVERVRELRQNWIVLVALDIKNVFNSTWTKIITAVRKKIPILLLHHRALSPRKIILTKTEFIEGDCGVSQGSVFGLLLTNILCDGVLGLTLANGVSHLTYADISCSVLPGASGNQGSTF